MNRSPRTLGWSDRPTWQESLGLAVVLAGIGGFLGLGSWLASWQAVVLVALLGVGLILVLWRVWILLFGPVLFYDLLRTTRRGRHVWLRCAYAGLLLAALFWVYASWFAGASRGGGLSAVFIGASLPAHDLPQFAGDFFATFMTVQFLAVVVLTPAYVAGSIAEEKERRSLEFLLASDLSNREIVLGKLVARLGNLLLLLLTGLPILAMTQLLGGVDPNLVLVGFAATGMIMLSLGSISLLHAIDNATLYEALFRTYSFAIVFLPMLGWLPWFVGRSPFELVFGLNRAFSSMTGEEQTAALFDLLAKYVRIHGLIALACITSAIVRLRKVTTRAAGLPVRAQSDAVAEASRMNRKRPEAGLGDEAVLWKEMHFENPELEAFNIGFIVVWGVVAILFFVYWSEGDEGDAALFIQAVGTGLICLMMLVVALLAAGSLARERQRQTLDSLLTTPVERGDILLAKWLGSLWSVRYLAAGLVVVYLLGVISRGMHVFHVPFVLIADAVYLMFAASLGLYFSATSRTAARATLWTLLGLFVLSVVPMLMGHYLDRLLAPRVPRESIDWVSQLLECGLCLPVSAWTLHSLPEVVRRNVSPHPLLVTFAGLSYFAIGARALWVMARVQLRADKGPRASSHLFRAAVVDQARTKVGTPAGLRGAVLSDESYPSEEPQQHRS